MRILGRTLALSLAALCVAPAIHADSSPGTLTCYNGGVSALTINLTSFFFDTFSSQFFTVYTDAANFDDLTYQRFFTSTFDYCQFSTSNRTFPSIITEEGVAVNVGMGGTYTQVTFSYVGLTGTPAAMKMSLRPPQTPEEKAKSLADFLARAAAAHK